jgi:hypothetical protein
VTKREWAVIRAAKEWFRWLEMAPTGADYHTYHRKFTALRKAVRKLVR